jgi:plasmid maintenance system antidote protein VapI
MTGIRQHHISEMENHKRPIGKKNALKFAKALGTNYKVFL